MIKKLLRKWLLALMIDASAEDPTKKSPQSTGIFSTHMTRYNPNSGSPETDRAMLVEQVLERTFQKSAVVHNPVGSAMDAFGGDSVKANYQNTIPEVLLWWYGQQSFIGYQTAAILSQQWLISKACLMPAKDAVRNGYEVTVNDGTIVDAEVLDAIRKADRDFQINKNLIEMVQMGRVFGIRVVMFIVDSIDPNYYAYPFNPDGVTPGSYKGISQIDPYWITPLLDDQAAGNPAAIGFYEPTWWQVNGRKVHRTHLVVFRTEEVPDILKPTYIYGGISIPQKIYERVYAAERTANEAPMLAMTKRMDVLNVDMTEVAANPAAFWGNMEQWRNNMNNYGVKALGLNETLQQFDTSLTDLDAVIMTQYQLVAAAANVPAVKLLGTSPKGFNTTGEFEEANYHEELQSIQTHDLTPLLTRHHLLLIRSLIAPMFHIEPFDTSISWNELDAMTSKEQAELNKTKAETDNILSTAGAVDGYDIRQRIIQDPDSGYNGLIDDEPPEQDDGTPNNPDDESDVIEGVQSDPDDA